MAQPKEWEKRKEEEEKKNGTNNNKKKKKKYQTGRKMLNKKFSETFCFCCCCCWIAICDFSIFFHFLFCALVLARSVFGDIFQFYMYNIYILCCSLFFCTLCVVSFLLSFCVCVPMFMLCLLHFWCSHYHFLCHCRRRRSCRQRWNCYFLFL